MITVTFNQSYFTVEGHATPRVCAAVSTASQMTALGIANNVYEDDGYFRAFYNDNNPNAQSFLNVFREVLRQLQEQYPQEVVLYDSDSAQADG